MLHYLRTYWNHGCPLEKDETTDKRSADLLITVVNYMARYEPPHNKTDWRRAQRPRTTSALVAMRKLPPGPKPAWRPRGQIITSIRVERFTCTNLELRFFSQFGPSDSGFQYLFSWQSIAGRKYLIICSLFDWLWAFDCVLKGFVFTPAWGWHAVPLCSSNGPCCASPQGLITQSSAPSNCYLV